MKKLLLALGVIAALSLIFVGCGEPKDETPAEETSKECVIFDPASYTGDKGTVEEVDGEKYLKITVDGYNTSIAINPGVDLKGKTTFKCKMYGAEANAKAQYIVKLGDKDNADISSITMNPVVATATETSAGVAVKTDWNKVSSTMLCEVVQPMVQSTEDYSAMSNVVVYIGKIIAE